MFIRSYLRASTEDQDATRAKQTLIDFAKEHGHRIAHHYIENESGASLQRPELFKLLEASEPGDVILVEQVDRLSRLTNQDWQRLRQLIKARGILVVALDLPTSHRFLSPTDPDDFTGRMLAAINDMLLDMLAAIARKDYEDRQRRQQQGITKAKADKLYKGRSIDQALHQRIKDCLAKGLGVRGTAKAVDCAVSTVQRVKATALRETADRVQM